MQTDAGLVEECRAGDASAFDEIVRRYKDRVYRVVYRFLGNHEDASDVAQETFIRAYRGIQDYRGAAQMCTWLHSIAANLARNRLRDGGRKGRDMGVSLDSNYGDAILNSEGMTAGASGRQGIKYGVPAIATPRDAAEQHELEESLQRCLTELPEPYRMAFALRTFDDLSYEAIAETLGIPIGTVKSRINQARRMLRERLEELALV